MADPSRRSLNPSFSERESVMRLALFSPFSLIVAHRKGAASRSTAIAGSDRLPERRPYRPYSPYRPSPWQRWRTRQQLARLDERQLKDIGLTPAQARRESHRPFWR
ncbi:DUF1127 domain-containing protein [Salinicola halophyticus]|uniref:DUF1127 domain-containing protein n=1 Tax=Salinicola halophyticus TaxID=1808881 RepID=UPI003F449BE5